MTVYSAGRNSKCRGEERRPAVSVSASNSSPTGLFQGLQPLGFAFIESAVQDFDGVCRAFLDMFAVHIIVKRYKKPTSQDSGYKSC
jgi:hypothetical protein